LVREIDALDGIMGRVADDSGIHFKMLNQRKGPAVRGPRCQSDRDLYKAEMMSMLSDYPNLRIHEASVDDIILSDEGSMGPAGGSSSQRFIQGVRTEAGEEIAAQKVILTTGTFLRGTIMLGQKKFGSGRQMRTSDDFEPPSVGLALTLERLQFPLARLKTGTPPRLDSRTIDWDILDKQASDLDPQPFSYLNIDSGVKMRGNFIQCGQTYTNEETHKIVMGKKHLLPDYDGAGGDGVGPRYCPSIFKKCERFPDRDRHMVWLEPEGLNSNMVYPNGTSKIISHNSSIHPHRLLTITPSQCC
jgi:tRNA uridine 5-carboxymethylaminomethyl modification enzyme